MANQDTIQKPKKFLFDINNFDDREEPTEPPPPTFSEQELADARKDAYDRGKRDGLAEAAASREKHVAMLTERISQNFSLLFAAEAERDALYEAESVTLARAIFARLFPALNAKQGLEEIHAVVTSVLESRRTLPEIFVEVHPDYVEDIKATAANALKSLHGTGVCTVTGMADLGPADCRMSWNNGGAQRSAQQIAGQIAEILEQTLAGRASLRDNDGSALGAPDSREESQTP